VRAHARLLVNRARVYAATARRLPATPRASWSARGVPSAPDRPNRRDRRRGNLRSLGAVLWRSNMPNEFVGKTLQRLALAAFAQINAARDGRKRRQRTLVPDWQTGRGGAVAAQGHHAQAGRHRGGEAREVGRGEDEFVVAAGLIQHRGGDAVGCASRSGSDQRNRLGG